MVASSGQTVRIALKEIRVVGRNTQGVRLANLKDASLVAVQRVAMCEGDLAIEIEDEPAAEILDGELVVEPVDVETDAELVDGEDAEPTDGESDGES